MNKGLTSEVGASIDQPHFYLVKYALLLFCPPHAGFRAVGVDLWRHVHDGLPAVIARLLGVPATEHCLAQGVNSLHRVKKIAPYATRSRNHFYDDDYFCLFL